MLKTIYKNMTLDQRLVAINAGMFLLVAGGAIALMSRSWPVPEEPPLERIQQRLENLASEVVTDKVADPEDHFPRFGAIPAFQDVITKPTPSPTPPPTPKPDPELAEAIKTWKLDGVAKGLVFVSDKQSKEEWIMTMKDPASLKKTKRFKNEDMEIILESVDAIQMTATFVYEGKQGKQTLTKGMFDED